MSPHQPDDDDKLLTPEERKLFASLPGFDLAGLIALLREIEDPLRRDVVRYLSPRKTDDHDSQSPILDAKLDVPRVPGPLKPMFESILYSRPFRFDLRRHDAARNRAIMRMNSVPLLLCLARSLEQWSAMALLVRCPPPQAFEAVLIPETDPAIGRLAAGVNALFLEWRAHGRTPSLERIIRVDATEPPPDFSHWFIDEILTPKLVEVATAPVVRLEGIGEVRALPLSIIV